MPITTEAWNVTIVGFWNQAIYSPSGISRHLFLLPPNSPVQVLIPIDLPAPYQVQHEGQTIMVGSDRLVVTPTLSNFAGLATSLEIARRALDHLPRTPFIAAGINIRYKSDGPVAALEEIAANAWDERLSDEGLEIRERTITRGLHRGSGRINVTITQKDDRTFFIGLNFDLQSDDVAQLRTWMNSSADDLKRDAERILYNTIGVRPDEVIHG
jgi:hypothetical protein